MSQIVNLLLVFLSCYVLMTCGASIQEPEKQDALGSRSWFGRALTTVENAFKNMVTTLESGFIKSVEEKKESGEGSQGFANRTQEIIEVFGQKFLKTRTVEKNVTNNTVVSIFKLSSLLLSPFRLNKRHVVKLN